MKSSSSRFAALTISILLAVSVAACGGDGGDDGSPGSDVGGVCMGLLGAQCKPGLYCDVEDFSCGAADQTGVCTEIPEVCTAIFSPVCGCDGKTYGNKCEAAAAGISLVSETECSSGS